MSMQVIESQEWQEIDSVIDSVMKDIELSSRPSYKEAIEQFIGFCVSQGNLPFRNPHSLFVSYKDYLRDSYRPSTANKKLSAVRKLIKFAAAAGYVTYPQFAAIENTTNLNDLGGEFRTWLEEDQAQSFFAAPDSSTCIGKRDKVAILFMLVLGLRRAEAVSIRWNQIIQQGEFWLVKDIKGKGGRVRSVKIPTQYMEVLYDYSEACAGADPEGYILVHIDRHGNHYEALTPRAIGKIVDKYAQQLDYRITPHGLRRTCATLAYRNGADMDMVRQMLGHSTEVTTRHYLKDSLYLENAATDYVGV